MPGTAGGRYVGRIRTTAFWSLTGISEGHSLGGAMCAPRDGLRRVPVPWVVPARSYSLESGSVFLPLFLGAFTDSFP